MDNPLKINSVTKPGESLFKDKGSKHLGFIFPVTNENEAKQKLEEIKNLHPKANHHCFSYVIANGNQPIERYSDDVEPSGSAGLPIFNQLKKAELQNALAIVVRYFGGTKLGVGGLINAYRTATELAIENATINSKIPTTQLKISVSFDNISNVNQIINQNRIAIINEEYTNNYAIFVEVEYHLVTWLNSLFENIPYIIIEEF